MNTFVHVLEGLTALLVLLLLVQVIRHYRANAVSAQSSESIPVKVSHVEKREVSRESDVILNDYIGGFFDEGSDKNADIQAFKVPASPLLAVKELEEVEETEEVEDDTIITVMSEADDESGNVTDKVMTDKVVHAMLDEAKLACSS